VGNIFTFAGYLPTNRGVPHSGGGVDGPVSHKCFSRPGSVISRKRTGAQAGVEALLRITACASDIQSGLDTKYFGTFFRLAAQMVHIDDTERFSFRGIGASIWPIDAAACMTAF